MELHVPFRATGTDKSASTPVTQVRSTLIVSGIQALRARGFYEQYLAVLEPSLRAKFSALTTGEWLPIELGVAHYRAADKLRLDTRTIEGIGGEVATRINSTPLSVAIKLSKRVGVTPWTALSLAHRINDLNWRGGDIAIWKAGAKEALYQWVGQPCASVPYFLTSFSGYLRELSGLFAQKAHARPVPEQCTPTTIMCRISWI